MDKFRSFFRIGSISDNNIYLGLSPDSAPGTVLNTLDQNIVYRIQLRRHLRCWQESDININKGKIKLPKPLEEIISFDDKHTILVYEDGTCESLGNRAEKRETNWSPIVVNGMHKIINVACFNTWDGHVMLTYFLRNRETGAMEFVYFRLDDESMTPSADDIRRTEIPTRNGLTLSAFTVVEGDKFPSVMTIWSDKRIFMLALRGDENTSTAFQMIEMFNCLRVDKPLTVVSVGPNSVAIYGGNAKQDGASLVLYNTKHHIVKCIQPFKVHLDDCRLWVIGTYIFMSVGQRLSCAQFPVSEENARVNKDCINEECELEETTTLNVAALGSRVNGVHTNSAKPFKHKQPTLLRRESDAPTEIPENFESNLRSLYNFDIPVEVIQQHSLSNAMIVELVETLQNCGTSETEITEHLIPLLINAKLTNELATCLCKYTNVSERMLAKSLKYFIGMAESDQKLTYINHIFACSFDKELIKEHLRTNLNLDNAVYLLELIHRDLVADEFLLVESPQYGHDFDSDVALINWFTVILDAHYQQFLLARDPTVNEMILKWKTLIESFVSGMREMKAITVKLKYLVNGKMKPNNNRSSKWYSVEKVKLY